MRATVAKRIRRITYDGAGHHPGPVAYYVGGTRAASQMPRSLEGCCVADQKRRDYQAMKRHYLAGLFTL